MKRVLVLGKNGFVAKAFFRYIEQFKNEYELTCVTSHNHEWKKCDFRGFDAVFNASGLAHANAKDGSDEDYYEVNGRLPGEIATKAKAEGVPIYISMSSSIIYGDMSNVGTNKVITKDTVPEPEGVYGKSKIMGEEGVLKLADDTFHTAIIRPPMIYSEYAPENFELLCKFAIKFPIFPKLYNEQSMIYADNLCELLRLIIENNTGGIYYPQEKEFIQTSKLVKDISEAAGKRMLVTRVFNPVLKVMSKKVRFVRKAFGSVVYDKGLSDSFSWNYCVVPYEETVRRIAERYGRSAV
ncbi:MAG: hypothetical protein EUB_02384 [Eubacterium sp.]|uniref:NAD-dependent epimerase/dehydratase family protein n=1 Tax=Eubacterium sp. TaxID=142586 RepID=UPI00304E5C58